MVYKYLQIHSMLENTSVTEPNQLDNAKYREKTT